MNSGFDGGRLITVRGFRRGDWLIATLSDLMTFHKQWQLSDCRPDARQLSIFNSQNTCGEQAPKPPIPQGPDHNPKRKAPGVVPNHRWQARVSDLCSL